MNLIDNSISEQLAINCKFTIYEFMNKDAVRKLKKRKCE